MKEFMIVPPSTPSGATSSAEVTIPLEEIEPYHSAPITRDQIEDYFVNLSPKAQQQLLSVLRSLAATKPRTSTKKQAPDPNQLSFDDIG